ncbi:MAG TPA: hypothetical protein VHP36_07730 [Chitinispirillaceae bacterium]|nr:hypothetical protein [Chitinispirillaceae bacterium]
MTPESIEILEKTGTHIHKAHVLDILDNGEILVSFENSESERRVCDILQTSQGDHLEFHRGDKVLVAIPDGSTEGGYILGRIGAPAQKKKRVVIDASDDLTIQCGKGSIKIDKEGRILIKGLEIVSSAKGKNRIRGGSIQLN